MKINISKARITRNAFEVSEHIPTGTSVIFQGEGQVSGVRVSDNNDGTVNTVSDIKPSILEVKTMKDNKYKPIFKDEIEKKSISKGFRNKLYVLWETKGLGGTFEGFYNSYYDELNKKLDQQLDEIIMGA
jgi:hypothetical protein